MHRATTPSRRRPSIALTPRKLSYVIGILLLLVLVVLTGYSSLGRAGTSQKAAAQHASAVASGSSTSQELVRRGGTLRFALNHEPLTFDPQRGTENASGWTDYLFFDQ